MAKPNIDRMENKRDVGSLVKALQNPDAGVRQSAASALDRLGWAPVEGADRVRYLIAKAAWPELAQAGSPAVEPLIAVLEDKDQEIAKGARTALEELARHSPDAAIGPLTRAAQQDRGWMLPAEILGTMGDPRAIEPLIGALRHEQFISFQQPDGTIEPIGVVRSLVSFGRPAVGPLIRALQGGPSQIQGAALALGLIGDPSAAEPLAEALGKSELWASRPHVARALQSIGEPAVAPLVQLLGHADPWARAEAARILGEIGDARSTEALAYALEDKAAVGAWPVARAAAMALTEMGDSRGMMYLVLHQTELAGDNHDRAIEAARKVGKPAVGALIGALKSENAFARICAADALAAIEPNAHEAVPALILGLQDSAGGMHISAAKALGSIGPQAMAAVPHLIQAMRRFLEGGPAWNALKAITGQDLPKDAAAWQRWWAARIQESACPHCGRAVKAGARFCTNCGTRLA